MKKLFKKKVNVFGKGISLSVIVVLGLAVASAALLSYYGVITGEVTAEQSVLVDNKNYQIPIKDEVPEDAPGGEMFCFKHILENKASVPAEVKLANDCHALDLQDKWMNCDGAYKTHYIMPEEVILNLCSKDDAWKCDGRMNATLTFDPVNERFKGKLITSGLNSGVQYALIYYADKPERFENWGGDNPGKVIKIFDGDQTSLIINENLGMNLPSVNDANIDEYNYCGSAENDTHTGDDYTHCHGAKLWIVPTSALTSDSTLPMDEWVQSEYLFETDLMVYFDCNLGIPSNYPVDIYDEYSEGTSIVINSKETIDFINCYEFAINIKPGTYTFTTQIEPVN